MPVKALLYCTNAKPWLCYDEPQSVILTIRKGGKRVETCEISKPRREIIQLYGPHDTTPKCQWKVKKAVMAAMPYILK